jgi:hypothetical protein
MSFFRKRKLYRHQALVLRAAENLVSEDDRVYRNQVELFCRDGGVAGRVSGRGLYKARLFGACFPMFAFTLRWSDADQEWSEMLQAVSGLAISTLVEASADPHFSRDDAKELTPAFMKRQFSLIREELDSTARRVESPTSGPVTALVAGGEGSGFLGLVDSCHDALAESITSADYTAAVRNRFEPFIRSSVYGRLKVMTDLIQAMA